MLDVKDIMEIIPHRYPFLFIDMAEIVEEGIHAIGYKNVSYNEPFFQGHFPNEPIMPGVLLIEAIAQVCAIALLSQAECRGKIVYFTGIKDLRFRNKVVPGDSIIIEAIIKIKNGRYCIATGTITKNEVEVCEAELSFAICN